MFELDNADMLINDGVHFHDTDLHEILTTDWEKFKGFLIMFKNYNRYSHRIRCHNLDTSSPLYCLDTLYVDSDIFLKIEYFDKPVNLEEFIYRMIDKINNDFNEEAYTYFNEGGWKGYNRFKDTVLDSYKSYSVATYNELVRKLVDDTRNGYYDFKFDSNFELNYAKHRALFSDEQIPLDMDAFFINRVFKIKR